MLAKYKLAPADWEPKRPTVLTPVRPPLQRGFALSSETRLPTTERGSSGSAPCDFLPPPNRRSWAGRLLRAGANQMHYRALHRRVSGPASVRPDSLHNGGVPTRVATMDG